MKELIDSYPFPAPAILHTGVLQFSGHVAVFGPNVQTENCSSS